MRLVSSTPCMARLYAKDITCSVMNVSDHCFYLFGIHRTLFDAIKDLESDLNDDHREYITLLLKKELQAYKTQR